MWAATSPNPLNPKHTKALPEEGFGHAGGDKAILARLLGLRSLRRLLLLHGRLWGIWHTCVKAALSIREAEGCKGKGGGQAERIGVFVGEWWVKVHVHARVGVCRWG